MRELIIVVCLRAKCKLKEMTKAHLNEEVGLYEKTGLSDGTRYVRTEDGKLGSKRIRIIVGFEIEFNG